MGVIPFTCQRKVCSFTPSLVVSAIIKDGCCQEWIHVTVLTRELNSKLLNCCRFHSLQQWCGNQCLQAQSPCLLRVVKMWVMGEKSALIFSRVCKPVPVECRSAHHGHHRECSQTSKIFDIVCHNGHTQHHKFCEARKWHFRCSHKVCLRRGYCGLEDLCIHHIVRPITKSWNHLHIESNYPKTSTGERLCDME